VVTVKRTNAFNEMEVKLQGIENNFLGKTQPVVGMAPQRHFTLSGEPAAPM